MVDFTKFSLDTVNHWPVYGLDLDDNKVISYCAQDVELILAANVEHQKTRQKFAHPMRFIGRIPLVTAEQWAREAGVSPFSREMTDIVKRKLRDAENSKLRTTRLSDISVR